MGTVPMAPTIRLSSMLTMFVTVFWMIIGMTMIATSR